MINRTIKTAAKHLLEYWLIYTALMTTGAFLIGQYIRLNTIEVTAVELDGKVENLQPVISNLEKLQAVQDERFKNIDTNLTDIKGDIKDIKGYLMKR